jgi:two-component sensor histidine kinase
MPQTSSERAIKMKMDIVQRLDATPSPASNDYLLVRELSHRINNELASMIGFVSLAAARSTSGEVKNALAGVMNLLHSHAAAHHALEMPAYSTVVDAADYVRALCKSIRRTRLNHRNIRLVLAGHPLRMRSELCWKLGMIVSELITNSARHAFTDRGGTIRVGLSGSGRFAECYVMDDGSSRSPCQPGQGLKIVEALAKELNGEVAYHFGPEGGLSKLIFPISGEALQLQNDPLVSQVSRERAASPH